MELLSRHRRVECDLVKDDRNLFTVDLVPELCTAGGPPDADDDCRVSSHPEMRVTREGARAQGSAFLTLAWGLLGRRYQL